MPPTLDRLVGERAFHDRQAAGRARDLRTDDHLRFDDDAWLGHETWVRPAVERLVAMLGGFAGRDILDYGCGHGMAAVVFARAGANAAAFDLSAGYAAEARRRAAANGVAVSCVQADGHRLPFADASFDGVWGNAVLHHLDLVTAAAELRRVLRPGGAAVFCEPWGGNPFLQLARRRLPYPGKHRTPDEEPLTPAGVDAIRSVFPSLEVRGVQLLGMARRLGARGRLAAALDAADRRLLAMCPGLGVYTRYVVLSLRR
jgi:SAM-dependent methyltransferase